MTWRCDVCGDERPDARISVSSRTHDILGGRTTAKTNVKYCNDRPACVAGAEDHSIHHVFEGGP